MNARRKKTGARAVSARKATPARQSAAPKKAAKKAVKKSQALATVLGADCTIEHAPALHRQLTQVLADRACVTLDFSSVKRCDTAGLQLLAAFLRERRDAGLPVELTGTSDNFMTTANVLGLATLFGAADTGVA